MKVDPKNRSKSVLLGIMLFGGIAGCAQAPVDFMGGFTSSLNAATPGGDVSVFLDTWADDLEYTVSQANVRTKEDLKEFIDGWNDLFQEWEYVEVRRITAGHLAAWEGVARGIHKSSGKPLELPMAMIIEFDPVGKIRMVHVYVDTAIMIQQLGENPS
jgi:ketosteroid isomerase-like protein